MEVKTKAIKNSGSDLVFYILSGIFLTFFFLIVLYPIVFVIASSFSSGAAVTGGKVFLWPVGFNIDGYKIVLNNRDILSGFKNSLTYMFVGTTINVFLTMFAAYGLSREDLPGANGIMLFFAITLFFNGGLIPTFMLIRKLNLLDTMWSLVLPGAINIYNLVVARTFIKSSIPKELFEASSIDGCSDFKYFIKVVIPLSKAIIAVLILFYGIVHWNSYFYPMLYLSTRSKFTLPIFLKEILIANQIDPSTVSDPELMLKIAQTADVIKYALIVISIIPVLIIYPFAQKYFVKGVMIGSVKG